MIGNRRKEINSVTVPNFLAAPAPTPHRPPPFLTFWYRTSVSGGVAMTDVLLGAAALDFARLEGRILFNAEISCKISAAMQ